MKAFHIMIMTAATIAFVQTGCRSTDPDSSSPKSFSDTKGVPVNWSWQWSRSKSPDPIPTLFEFLFVNSNYLELRHSGAIPRTDCPPNASCEAACDLQLYRPGAGEPAILLDRVKLSCWYRGGAQAPVALLSGWIDGNRAMYNPTLYGERSITLGGPFAELLQEALERGSKVGRWQGPDSKRRTIASITANGRPGWRFQPAAPRGQFPSFSCYSALNQLEAICVFIY